MKNDLKNWKRGKKRIRGRRGEEKRRKEKSKRKKERRSRRSRRRERERKRKRKRKLIFPHHPVSAGNASVLWQLRARIKLPTYQPRTRPQYAVIAISRFCKAWAKWCNFCQETIGKCIICDQHNGG